MRGSRTTAKTASAFTIAMLAGSALLLSSCSSDGSDSLSGGVDDTAASSKDMADGPMNAESSVPGSPNSLAGDLAQGYGGDSARTVGSSGGTLADLTTEREVIATAEMTLRSEDVTATVDAIETIAASAGGFVSGRDVQSNPDDADRTRATVIVRVPTAKMDNVLDAASAEGDIVRVVSDEQDVTQTVVDVNSRVESARASVDRIRALLSQARTIGEVVRIESELSRREADLESLLAQQRALADQTEMATLSVTVLAPEAIDKAPEDDEGFLAGLERGWDALVGVVVVALTTLGVLLPFLVVAGLVLIPLVYALRRRPQPIGPAPQSGMADEREPEPVH